LEDKDSDKAKLIEKVENNLAIGVMTIMIAVAVVLMLAAPLVPQTTLGIKLSDQRTTVSNGELGFVIGHVQGQSDAKSWMAGNTTNYGSDCCVKTHPNIQTNPEDRNFCTVWAIGYVVGWREITRQDIDLPPPFHNHKSNNKNNHK
jgi:hypothetical protein